MHNRDMIWYTSDGKKLKIKCIPSTHLTNILKHIDKNSYMFNMKFGKKSMENTRYNITQEIRFRKLNRLNIESQGNELF